MKGEAAFRFGLSFESNRRLSKLPESQLAPFLFMHHGCVFLAVMHDIAHLLRQSIFFSNSLVFVVFLRVFWPFLKILELWKRLISYRHWIARCLKKKRRSLLTTNNLRNAETFKNMWDWFPTIKMCLLVCIRESSYWVVQTRKLSSNWRVSWFFAQQKAKRVTW